MAGPGGAAASDARFATFGAEPEALRSVTRAMSCNIVQVVKFDSGMRDELRCPRCQSMLSEPMLDEERATQPSPYPIPLPLPLEGATLRI